AHGSSLRGMAGIISQAFGRSREPAMEDGCALQFALFSTPVTLSESAPSANQVLVDVKRVSFAYDRTRTILRDINMSIPRGKVVAIMGLSGCGKTTLLRVIGGWFRPESGEVVVDN